VKLVPVPFADKIIKALFQIIEYISHENQESLTQAQQASKKINHQECHQQTGQVQADKPEPTACS